MTILLIAFSTLGVIATAALWLMALIWVAQAYDERKEAQTGEELLDLEELWETPEVEPNRILR
jgi:hypothetical protein